MTDPEYPPMDCQLCGGLGTVPTDPTGHDRSYDPTGAHWTWVSSCTQCGATYVLKGN